MFLSFLEGFCLGSFIGRAAWLNRDSFGQMLGIGVIFSLTQLFNDVMSYDVILILANYTDMYIILRRHFLRIWEKPHWDEGLRFAEEVERWRRCLEMMYHPFPSNAQDSAAKTSLTKYSARGKYWKATERRKNIFNLREERILFGQT